MLICSGFEISRLFLCVSAIHCIMMRANREMKIANKLKENLLPILEKKNLHFLEFSEYLPQSD